VVPLWPHGGPMVAPWPIEGGPPQPFMMKRRSHVGEKGAFIPSENAVLRGLSRLHSEWLRRAVMVRIPTIATRDLDATVLESHKRAALPHEKGGRGSRPTAVLWASVKKHAAILCPPRLSGGLGRL